MSDNLGAFERYFLSALAVALLITGIAIGLNARPDAHMSTIEFTFTAVGGVMLGGISLGVLLWRRPGLLAAALAYEEGKRVTPKHLVEAATHRLPPHEEDEHCPGA
jgi:hypothetical protein